jgi:hypothetical protein
LTAELGVNALRPDHSIGSQSQSVYSGLSSGLGGGDRQSFSSPHVAKIQHALAIHVQKSGSGFDW